MKGRGGSVAYLSLFNKLITEMAQASDASGARLLRLDGNPRRNRSLRKRVPPWLKVALVVTPVLSLLAGIVRNYSKLEANVEHNTHRIDQAQEIVQDFAQELDHIRERLIKLELLQRIDRSLSSSSGTDVEMARTEPIQVEKIAPTRKLAASQATDKTLCSPESAQLKR